MTARSYLICDKCGGKLHTRNTWNLKNTPLALVSRARVCQKCKKRFTTYEVRKDDFRELIECKQQLTEMRGMLRQLMEIEP